jgi:hypothetical protein
MFFRYFTSCGDINIHHIHICNDCLCFNNKLNLYYYHIFPMKHLLYLNKLWTIYHFMSIQTTNVACIWRCLLWFLTWFCGLCGCHYGLFFLLFTCFHIMIRHSIVCAMFINLPHIILCFHQWCLFGNLWYWKCIPCFYNSHTFLTQHCHLLTLLLGWPLHPCNCNFEV